MARLVRRAILVGALTLPLAGCTSTQHTAERVRLESARQLAALKVTRVTVSNRAVEPSAVAVIRGAGRTAFVVTVRNSGHRAVTDLPISVGYTRRNGTAVYLNARADLSYYQAHLPAIRAGARLTWVYTSHATVPAGARPFARVGLRRSVPAKLTEMGVRMQLSAARVAQDSVAVRLFNPTGVVQYQLQLYAWALRSGRFVAAGNATVAELGAGARHRLKLTLVGSGATGTAPASVQLHIEAVPTILQ